MKFCVKCKIDKAKICFSKNDNRCKRCVREYNRKYREDHKNIKKEIDKKYYQKNKKNILAHTKYYYFTNKDKKLEYAKTYYKNNKENINIKNKIYQKENKEKIQEYYRTYKKKRMSNDITYKLRAIISNSVYKMIKYNGYNKRQISCLKYLPFSFETLINHIESLFEHWMSWDNWGIYDSEKWDNFDSTTWTWQIDHIIPHSTFKYISMDCQEFKDCWALNNLRPLSAKQNIIDGNRTERK